MKFKAAVLVSLNQPLELYELTIDKLDFGQVLVKVISSGLCGAQLQEIQGLKGNANFLPHLLGHEGCGIVEEIGPAVTTVKPGDKVVMHWKKGSGLEAAFPNYYYNDILWYDNFSCYCYIIMIANILPASGKQDK